MNPDGYGVHAKLSIGGTLGDFLPDYDSSQHGPSAPTLESIALFVEEDVIVAEGAHILYFFDKGGRMIEFWKWHVDTWTWYRDRFQEHLEGLEYHKEKQK